MNLKRTRTRTPKKLYLWWESERGFDADEHPCSLLKSVSSVSVVDSERHVKTALDHATALLDATTRFLLALVLSKLRASVHVESRLWWTEHQLVRFQNLKRFSFVSNSGTKQPSLHQEMQWRWWLLTASKRWIWCWQGGNLMLPENGQLQNPTRTTVTLG